MRPFAWPVLLPPSCPCCLPGRPLSCCCWPLPSSSFFGCWLPLPVSLPLFPFAFAFCSVFVILSGVFGLVFLVFCLSVLVVWWDRSLLRIRGYLVAHSSESGVFWISWLTNSIAMLQILCWDEDTLGAPEQSCSYYTAFAPRNNACFGIEFTAMASMLLDITMRCWPYLHSSDVHPETPWCICGFWRRVTYLRIVIALDRSQREEARYTWPPTSLLLL